MFNGMNGLEILKNWPRYESGELVQIGDEFMGKDGKTYAAKQIQFIGKCFSLFDFCDRKPQFSGFYGERPALAVLAADGEPLEVGQTVYHVDTGDEFYVSCFSGGTANVSDKKGGGLQLLPSQLTHRLPVLDADGVPIKKGDTVYEVGENYPPLIVGRLPEPGAYRSVRVVYPSGAFTSLDPERLTHTKPEPPDSWERIAEDAGCTATKYNERRGTIFTTKQQVARDLVRRCRALAERERGE